MSEADMRSVFSANLVFFMKLNNVSRRHLSDALNVPYRTVCDWVNGIKYPRPERIDQIVDYFNINRAALLEKHETSTKISGLLHISDIYDDLNENGQKALADYADFLYSKPENRKDSL